MPYMTPVELRTRPTATYQLVQSTSDYSWSSPPINGSVNSLGENFAWYEYRWGQNSSEPDLMRVFGLDNFDKVIRRRRVGWEYRFKKVRSYFTDPQGRRRYRVKTVRVRIPIVVRYIDFVLKKVQERRILTEYLKPNPLEYKLGYSFLAPKNLQVSFSRVGMPVGWYDGYYQVTGPGTYRAPSYYAPVVPIGLPLSYPPNATPIPSLNEQALRGLYTKVYSDVPDYFTATAELPELISLVRRTAVESLKLIKEIYRLDKKRLAKRLSYKVTPKDLSQLWLTYIYGIMPVLNDIVGTIEVVSRDARTWRSFTRTSKQTVVLEDADHTPINYSRPITDTTTHSSTWGVIISGQLTPGEYLMRASHWQKTAATIYEVVPFSFMLDWVADISGYLNACQIFEGLSYEAWNTYSFKREYAFNGKFVYNPDYPANGRWSSPPFSVGYLNFAMKRVIHNVLPDMPDIVVTKPPQDFSSLNRMFSVVALLVTGGSRSGGRRGY